MLQDLRRPLQHKGLSDRTVQIIAASWRASTKNQYYVFIRKWKRFCAKKSENYMQATPERVLEFLTELYFVHGASYSSLNTARSALAAFLILDGPYSVGSHPLISRFLKGVFQLRPPKPRYSQIWDVKIVLNFLRKWSPANCLNFKQLTLKLVMLMALISAQRAQALHNLNLERMKLKEGSVVFAYDVLLKQHRPGNASSELKFKAYPVDRRLCVIRYLKQYICRTKHVRGEAKQLFISFQKPHNPVSKQTISRWIKSVMSLAGIDTGTYKPHSTRAAATSAANRSDVPVEEILSKAGWSNEKTFRKFYQKPLNGDGGQFARAVLDCGPCQKT